MDGLSATANNFVDGKYAAIAPLEELVSPLQYKQME